MESDYHHLGEIAQKSKHIAEVERRGNLSGASNTAATSTTSGTSWTTYSGADSNTSHHTKAEETTKFSKCPSSNIKEVVKEVSARTMPKKVTNSFGSMVDEEVVKEFTVTGNKLPPVAVISDDNDKKRPRGESTSLREHHKYGDRENDFSHHHRSGNSGRGTVACTGGSNNSVSGISDEGDDEDDYSDDNDYDDDDEDHVIGVCLHCGLAPPPVDGTTSPTPTAPGIQVSCDDCHSFICSACHWCHEYQANHEIRVCDRCDAFYCKGCDEMDQCEDCGEVVCASCGALCSCKFCGCGLCEDCATACGR